MERPFEGPLPVVVLALGGTPGGTSLRCAYGDKMRLKVDTNKNADRLCPRASGPMAKTATGDGVFRGETGPVAQLRLTLVDESSQKMIGPNPRPTKIPYRCTWRCGVSVRSRRSLR